VKQYFLAAFFSAQLSAAAVAVAQDWIDDKSLLRSFESQFQEVQRAGTGLSANEVRRILKRELSFEGQILPVANTSALTAGQIYGKARAATLLVGHLYLCADCDKLHGSAAGGVVISPDGLALTNYHVLEFARAKVFGAMTADGKAYPIREVLASSRQHDLALIRLDGASDLPFLPLAEKADVGDPVFLVSHPDSHFYTLTRGHISRYYLAPRSKAPRLQITADFARGSSGCGVLSEAGQLIGLVTSTNSIYYTQEKEVQKDLQMVINSCIPLSSIQSFLKGPAGQVVE
jgi:S1-C subfamily serine protease